MADQKITIGKAEQKVTVVVEQGSWAEHWVSNRQPGPQPKALGAYLVKLRKKGHHTQEAVAEGAEVSQSYMSQLEQGKRGIPRPDLMWRIADFHGIAAESLWVVAGLPMKPMFPSKTSGLGLDEQFRRMINHSAVEGVFEKGDEQWIAPLVKRRWVEFTKRLIEHCQHAPDVSFDHFLADAAWDERSCQYQSPDHSP